VDKARAGSKKHAMQIFTKMSGQVGKTFDEDAAVYFEGLEQVYQMILHHISLVQMKKLDLVLEKLNLKPDKTDLEYVSPALELHVQSQRAIYLLETPIKIHVSSEVNIKWAVTGLIPHVTIQIQIAHLGADSEENQKKKKYLNLEEKASTGNDSLGQYSWRVPADFMKTHGKHGSYRFRLIYYPPKDGELVIPVKVTSDKFKIRDPKDKKDQKEKGPISKLGSQFKQRH